MPKSIESTFVESEPFQRIMETAQELDYTEVWHLIRKLQMLLAEKSYVAAKARGETNGV